MTTMMSPISFCLVSASVSGSKSCQSGLEVAQKELTAIVNENPPQQGEEANEGTLADWRSRVTDKAKELADAVIACRPIKVSERDKLMTQAVRAIIRATEHESYVYTRKEAAENIIGLAEKMVKAKVPDKSTGWALDRAQDIVFGLNAQKERESAAASKINDPAEKLTTENNSWWNVVDLKSLSNKITEIRRQIGYLNLGKAR